MSSEAVDQARALLAAWREQGADRLDPVRYHFIQGLARRADSHSGEPRQLLDARLSELLRTYQDGKEGHTDGGETQAATGQPQAGAADGGPLAELAAYIASRKPRDGVKLDTGGSASQGSLGSELSSIDYFRNIWSRVGAKRLLRQSKAKVPDNAGPLNSTNLVHRSLALMGERSPEYLHHFLSYVDALSWLEQLSDSGFVTGKEGTSGPAARKPPRGRQR
ncbi:DUF2894 domain-containing protein [Pollutimonas sp. M17]|uniref:DUF2894 domain-containing protein n=1 Tax=Pollutimonas sp. M17 TaxID=2962065 RepID=UPI0021F4697A|nr:DUF2894 domain-containing protein [Pollutimonas sp. M17]UYO92389.1 DUF2894 domain-containing protein [Pollutimonas sp. M17]